MNCIFTSSVIVYLILLIIIFKKSFLLVASMQKKEQIMTVLSKKEITTTAVMWIYVLISSVVVFSYGKTDLETGFWGSAINGVLKTLLAFVKPRRLFVVGLYVFLLIKQRRIDRLRQVTEQRDAFPVREGKDN